MKTFKLTEGHIKLLRRSYVRWEDIESGAPAINPKRPYGNSDVVSDVLRVLFDDELPEGVKENLRDYAWQMHMQTEFALQIVLATGEFKPGIYELTEQYDPRSWRLSQ